MGGTVTYAVANDRPEVFNRAELERQLWYGEVTGVFLNPTARRRDFGPTNPFDNRFTLVTDRTVAQFLPLGDIKFLDLSGSRISDHSAKLLPHFQRLESLNLAGTLITDDGLSTLPKLECLRSLDLSDVSITDRGLEHVSRCRNLETLTISITRQCDGWLSRRNAITNDGILALTRISTLKRVDVRGRRLSERTLSAFRQPSPTYIMVR